ncbi:MAG: hypothetical protein GKR99_16740 [Rhodobacteraceae bacterium]|nr:hypothetical protein [Paracoccaceae bacterium]
MRPETLTHFFGPSVRIRKYGRIRGGSWDIGGPRFDESWRAQCCRLHWLDGQSWAESGVYDHMAAGIAKTKDGAMDGCRTHDDVVKRYQQLDTLYEAASVHGLPSRATSVAGRMIEHDGITVHMARDGRLLVGWGGNHRLAMAQCLGLEWVPAGLGLVHARAARQLRFRRSEAARTSGWYIA